MSASIRDTNGPGGRSPATWGCAFDREVSGNDPLTRQHEFTRVRVVQLEATPRAMNSTVERVEHGGRRLPRRTESESQIGEHDDHVVEGVFGNFERDHPRHASKGTARRAPYRTRPVSRGPFRWISVVGSVPVAVLHR